MFPKVIKVQELSKRYSLGEMHTSANSFRDKVTGLFKKRDKKIKRETFWALRDVSFEVRQGEVVGIIGRNGAGKSTLLKILSRITSPTKGKIIINGRVACLLEVGTGFHPELTGRENIYLNGAILGMKKGEIDRKFGEIVDFAEIEKFIDTPVKRYSSGMYVRLAFAVAAHLEPETLLVDEVLAVGDIDFQKKCLGKMHNVARGGRTVLFVSHRMSSVVNLCDRAILLNKGQLLMDGAPSEVIRYYLASGELTGGEIKWDEPGSAPGNDDIKLHSVSIHSPDGNITSSLNIEDDIIIKITYWNFTEGSNYIKNINLKDQYGNWVLTTVNTPSASLENDEWFNCPHPIGLFESICRIPGNFLNNQTYYLYLAIAPYRMIYEPAIREENIISFTIHDTGAMTKEYHGGWLGPVRPRLYWQTKCIKPGCNIQQGGKG